MYCTSNPPTSLLNSRFPEFRDLFNLISILPLSAYSFLFGYTEQNQRAKLNTYSNFLYFPIKSNFPKEKSLSQNISQALHLSLFLKEFFTNNGQFRQKNVLLMFNMKLYFPLYNMVDFLTYPEVTISFPSASSLEYQNYRQCLKIP